MPAKSPVKTPSASTSASARARASSSKNTPSSNNKKSASTEKIQKEVTARSRRRHTPVNKKMDVDLSQAIFSPPVLAGAQSAKDPNQNRTELDDIKSTVQKLLELQQLQQQLQQQLLQSQPQQPQQQAPAPVVETIDASAEGQRQVEFVLSEFDKLADAYNSKDGYQSVLTDVRKMATKIDSESQFKERVRYLLDKYKSEVSKLDLQIGRCL